MVERLKEAIEKAREQRAALAGRPVETRSAEQLAEGGWRSRWSEIPLLDFKPDRLQENRVVTYEKSDPIHVAFDILRTRILKVASDNNWRKVGITSPTFGCGKTTVAANLAFSFARRQEMRVVILDFDMRAPRLARLLAARGGYKLREALEKDAGFDGLLRRIGDNLLVLLNTDRVPGAAEWLLNPRLHAHVDAMIERFAPDLVLVDLPPLLAADDTLAVMPRLDATMLVAAAGRTKISEVDECERLISERTQFLGVVLNRYESELGEGYNHYQEYGALENRNAASAR